MEIGAQSKPSSVSIGIPPNCERSPSTFEEAADRLEAPSNFAAPPQNQPSYVPQMDQQERPFTNGIGLHTFLFTARCWWQHADDRWKRCKGIMLAAALVQSITVQFLGYKQGTHPVLTHPVCLLTSHRIQDIEKARSLAERALRTINIREESEKLNIWVAYFNLENEYGNPPEEAVSKIFQRALQYCDPKKVHLALLGMYERTEQKKLAEELLDKMTRKFKHSCKVA